MNTDSEKDPHLWEIAKKRAGFKRHLTTYIIINIFLWAVWYFTGNENYQDNYYNNFIPWPAWTTLGWGIGIAFHYFGAYVNTGLSSIEKEYQKLKNKQ